MIHRKLIKVVNLINITNEPDRSDETAVALGFFDGLHLGHRAVIKAVIGRENLVPTVFTFSNWAHLPKFKTQESIITDDVKLDKLREIGVEYVYAPDFESVKDYSDKDFVEKILAERLNAKLAVCGYDFRFGKNAEGDADRLCELCSKKGIDVIVIPAQKFGETVISSTRIRELIKNGDISMANRLLGYKMEYKLEVVHGAQRGRQMSFPTINQVIPSGNVLPKFGVYKSETVIDGKAYLSITNIGIKPTFGENKPLMETHIIGVNADLYGKILSVRLIDFVRGETKFSGMDELKKQIQTDLQYITK